MKELARDYFAWPGTKDEKWRRILQVLGTEVGRAVDPDFWIKKLDQDTQTCSALVVPDVRFPNEADWIHRQDGLLIRVIGRGGLVGQAGTHASETQILSLRADVEIINDGTVEELHAQVSRITREWFRERNIK